MKPESLVRDPVFQLNLLLWMTKEQPQTFFVVRPWFFEQGFRLIYIEQPFAFPQSAINDIDAAGLEISKAPEPEMLIGRQTDHCALYFEAKKESFASIGSSTAKQARGHLLATGVAFSEVMSPLRSCLLCYVIPEERRELMATCLEELTVEMTARNLSVGSSSVHGLSVQNTELHYSGDERFQQFAHVDERSIVVMEGLSDDTDPTPLFLIYSVEDYPDPKRQDLLRQALMQQVHAILVCELNALAIGMKYTRTAESLLVNVTDGIFEYVGRTRQKQMRDFVRSAVLRRIADYSRQRFDDIVTLDRWELSVSFPSNDRKSAFLEWIEDHKKSGFSTSRTPQTTRSLFDEDGNA